MIYSGDRRAKGVIMLEDVANEGSGGEELFNVEIKRRRLFSAKKLKKVIKHGWQIEPIGVHHLQKMQC